MPFYEVINKYNLNKNNKELVDIMKCKLYLKIKNVFHKFLKNNEEIQEIGKEELEGQKTLQNWCSPSSNLWGRDLGSESAASSPARQNGGSLQW